jgi:hypothetical protein
MEASGARRGGVLGAVLVAMALAAFASSASAATVHPYLGSFGRDGSTATAFGRAGAVAVDQSDGTVYVADTTAGAIYKFGPEGEPVDFAALGSNELTGLAFNAGEPGLVQLAVDATTHDLYVVENAPVNGVSVFHANGKAAEFSALDSHTLSGFTELCGVAVDSEGDVYAADYEGGISVFERSGAPLTSVAEAHVCGLAVGPGGDLYANRYAGEAFRLTPSAYPVAAATTYGAATTVDGGPVYGIAADPTTGGLYADERDAIVEYDASGARLGASGSEGAGALSESEGVAVYGENGGLFATAPGAGAGPDLVARYGPGEAELPRIEAEWAAAVGDLGATLNARVDPNGIASTYHFEYGTGPCAGGSCASTPDRPLGAGPGPVSVAETVGGLTPSQAYDFRIVVSTAAGPRPGPERAFRTAAPSSSSGFALPDGRAYELVSSGPDNNADLGAPGASAGLVIGGALPQRAAAGGGAFAFPSFTSFGAAGGAPNASYYFSRWSPAGWSPVNITPRDESRAPVGPVRSFSADLGTTAIVATGVLAPGAVPGYPNLYLRDNGSGTLTPITTARPEFAEPEEFCVNYIGASADGRRIIFAASGGLAPGAAEPEQVGQPDLYEWSATEGIRLVSVLPDGTAAATGAQLGFGPGNDSCLIDDTEVTRQVISADGRRIFWSETNPTRALFARVDGTQTIELDAAQGGSGESGGGTFLTAAADGSRVFFSDPHALVPGATEAGGAGATGDLYEYSFTDGKLTDLSAPAGAEPTEVLGLVGASEAGDYLYFVAEGALRPGATPGAANLYLDHEGSLSFVARLSKAEDGFDWNPFKRQTASVTPDGLHLAFVSIESLTGYENDLVGGGACRRDGLNRPEGTSACDEVFLYDAAGGGRISCVSCNPSGVPPVGPVRPTTATKPSRLNTVPGWTTPFEQPRYLSVDGSRLFFVSEEGLLPSDTDEEQDVYEFERPGGGAGDGCSTMSPAYVPASEGCLFLISTGRASAFSYLLDASADGGDVFLSTDQRLTADDEDGNYDIYDAKVGGRSAAAAPAATPCSGEGCRGEAGSPGSIGAITTQTAGGGDVKPALCPKGKARRAGRCRPKRPPARHRRATHKKPRKRGHGKKQGGIR